MLVQRFFTHLQIASNWRYTANLQFACALIATVNLRAIPRGISTIIERQFRTRKKDRFSITRFVISVLCCVITTRRQIAIMAAESVVPTIWACRVVWHARALSRILSDRWHAISKYGLSLNGVGWLQNQVRVNCTRARVYVCIPVGRSYRYAR